MNTRPHHLDTRYRRSSPAAWFTTLTLATLLASTSALPAQEHQHHPHRDTTHGADTANIGHVNFRASCAPEARVAFDDALAMLHHMMYTQARSRFTAIAERQQSCAMAHWGVAMTSFQPLWQRPSSDDLRTGWKVLQDAREIGLDGERERALVATTEAFFRNPDSDEWFARLHRWSDALRGAHEAFPADEDIAAFYGLSQIARGQDPGEDRRARNATAASVLRQVHARNPRHPGAIHYTIHADDITGRERASLEMVRDYDDVAPSVPHALHMPTHIYVRLGDWPQVIEWNRKSADAALRFPAGDRTSMHHIHALDYMLYAHLQRGEDSAARAVLDEAFSRGSYEENLAATFHLAVMPARFAIERRAWDEASRIKPRDPEYISWEQWTWPEALSWFARGLGAAHTGDLATARDAEQRMRELARRTREAGTGDLATYIEVDRHILSGTIAHRAGQSDSAVALMRSAVELDRTVQKHPVTPGALLPPNEALGDLLMALDRPADARVAYEQGLESWPARYRSVLGAARAAQAAGDTEAARQHYARLLEIAGEERGRAGLTEARQIAGR